MTSPQQPAERPNGSFVKHTRIGFDGRPVVSVLVREDDPRNPDTPQRWRSVEGRSGWFTWEQLHATGTVEPLFTSAEVAALATQTRWAAHRAARLQPAQASNSPSTSASTPPQRHIPPTRDRGVPRR